MRNRDQSDSVGSAGQIHCREAIELAIGFFRDRIGEGVPVKAIWDRTGGQTLPLIGSLPNTWTARNIFGRLGDFRFTAVGARNIPVDQAGFMYRIDGDDVVIDPDPMVIRGLAKSPIGDSVSSAQTPVGVDPISICWSVFSVLSLIWQVMHPKCDLQLGGSVEAEAVLSGDTIIVSFREMPSVRLTVIFEMMLSVTGLEISTEKVKMLLHGEGMIAGRIKSRELEVV